MTRARKRKLKKMELPPEKRKLPFLGRFSLWVNIKRFPLWMKVAGAVFLGGVLIAIFFFILPKKAGAAWFNEDWLYRAVIPVSSHTSAETRVYVTVTVDTATPIAAGKMQSDCGDMRFTSENGELLPYFINASPGCDNVATTIQVNFDTFSAGGQTIYFYYGNPSAQNTTSPSGFSAEAANYALGSVGSEERGPGPAAYWSFDDGYGQTAQDSSSSGLDGTITAATWQTEDRCVSGKCLYFDGTDDYVQTSSTTDLATFTAFAWIRPTALSGTRAIISHGGSPTDNGWSFETSESNIRLTFHGVGNYDSNLNILSTNTWQHVAVTLTGTTATFYLNGKQVGTATTGSLGVATHIYSIGAYPAGTNDYSGFIDEPKVYNYVRTAAQLKADYISRGSSKGVSSQMGGADQKYLSEGLVGYWKTDESSGDAVDSSGNGLTLTNNSIMAYGAGKFGNAATCDGTADYLNTTTTISGIKTVSFWVYPAAAANNYFINLINSSAYITIDGSGVVSATGFTSPSIYVKGVLSGTVTAAAWNLITVTTNTAINANAFAVGLTNDGVNNFCTNTSKLDEIRVYNRALSPKEVSDLYSWAPGPVGEWKFEEGAGLTAYDTSGNGNNGTLTGGPKWQSGCKYGKCIGTQIDGVQDYVNVPNPTNDVFDFPPTVDYTIQTWVKIITKEGYVQPLYRGGSSATTNGYEVEVHTSTNVAQCGYADGTTRDVAAGTKTLNDGQWHFISCVMDRSGGVTGTVGLHVFVDGIKEGSDTSLGATINFDNTRAIEIGEPDTGKEFDGSIDMARIYNYARTQKQIMEDMNAGHPSVGSPVGSVIAHWKFDEGYGATANDSTSNNNDLTLSSASWTNSGKFGRAWNGTGALWASSTDDADFDVATTTDYSVSLWFKSDSADNASATEYLFSKGLGAATSSGYAVYANTDGTLCFGIDDDTTWGPDVSSCSGNDIYDNAWHHLVAVRDYLSQDKTLIYVDGVLNDSDSDSTTATLENSNALYVGDSNGADGGDEFNGDMDEVKIYIYALTADEVKTEYNRGSPLVLGAAGDNSTYQPQATNQEYCVPGDSSACTLPVGEWKFEEKTGTFANDTSGNGKTGTLTDNGGSTLPAWKTGKIGSALDFDGSADYVNIPSPNLPTGDFTYETWVNLDDVSDETILMSLESASSTNELLLSINTGGKAQVEVNNATIAILTGAGYVSTGIWTHLSFTRSGSTITLYKNGVAYSTTGTEGTTLNFGTCNFLIGVDSDNNGTNCTYSNDLGNWADGRIDEVRIFNYARSAAQVAYDYNRGKPVGYWKMDECQGTQAYDSSGNSNTGTWSGPTGTYTGAGTCTDGLSTSTWYGGRTGKFNASLDFDGTDDYVNIPDPSNGILDFPGTGGWTAAAWIKTTNSNLQMVVAKDSNASGGRGYNLYTDGGVVKGDFFQGDGNVTTVASTNPSITDNVWHHIAWTYTYVTSGTSVVNIYVDSKLVTTASNVVGPIQNSVAALSIGARTYTGATNNFTGQIDDVKIFNYALTATQVKQVMNQDAGVRFGPSTGSP